MFKAYSQRKVMGRAYKITPGNHMREAMAYEYMNKNNNIKRKKKGKKKEEGGGEPIYGSESIIRYNTPRYETGRGEGAGERWTHHPNILLSTSLFQVASSNSHRSAYI